MDVRVGLWRRLSAKELIPLNCGAGEDSRVPWTARRSNQSILKEISPKYSLEGLKLKLKLQYFGHLMEELAHVRRPWCWERLKQEEKGMTQDEMVGWHHQLNGHKFEWSLEVGDVQGGLACCSPWGHKDSDTTEQLNWTELILISNLVTDWNTVSQWKMVFSTKYSTKYCLN